jgi:hypothetical protein
VKATIFTLYEGNYHLGVAALINSALAIGFDGVFIVGYRDRLPPWVQTLNAVGSEEYDVAGIRIIFYREQAPRHLGYHKPFAALEIFNRFPEIERLFYVDPDVTFLAPWQFFQDWAEKGVGLVEDSNFPRVHTNHPWRAGWRDLVDRAGLETPSNSIESYVNSGFVAVMRRDQSFLKTWANLTLAYEAGGGSTANFQMSERWKGIVSDQDLVSAAIMAWKGPLSIIGPEAMGFTNYYFILSHAIESPKPWAKSYFFRSLSGAAPTTPGGYFLNSASGPIQLFSKGSLLLRKLDFHAAKLVSRVWRRS